MIFRPKEIFLTKGVGVHKERLGAFEEALRDAGIAAFNLAHVSSIFPPHCKLISRTKALAKLDAGSVLFSVMARADTNENRRLIAASIGLAVPRNRNMYGYLAEHHTWGQNEEEAGDHSEDLAATMLATVLGVEFDPDTNWDAKEEVFRISGKIVRVQNVTQTAVGRPDGRWTTVIAAAVFVP